MPKPRVTKAITPERIRHVLRRTFGLRRLRDGQEAVIARVLAGLPTLALMPTGAGKSLCFQLPAVLLDGRTVVISPLIALMKDQCDALDRLGIAAVQVHSALPAAELAASGGAIADGSARIVFTTPEQLMRPAFVAALTKRPVALLVVDEAHCLSQWGFDFRPAFLQIPAAIEALGRPTVLALTATATDSVVDDITGLLAIPKAGVIGTGLFRPNLHYRAENFSRAQDRLTRLIALVAESAGSGLVYVATVKAAEEVHAALRAAGEPVGLYHGRLGAAKRHAAQDAFMRGEPRVMVATNAFGLGIDKPDIRFVIHQQMPAGLDAYCQESGRAGRDGAPADCTLLFVEGDRGVQQFFLAGRYPRLDDFRAVTEALRGEAPAGGWEPDALIARAGRRRKGAVAVNVLRVHGLVRADERGLLTLNEAGAETAALIALADDCEAKAVHDRESLERMVAYAQSGQCRWKLLLRHLEGTPALERCDTCDNCLRLAAHEAQHAVDADADANADADAASPSTGTRFAIGQRVRTKRHGTAEVVASDALSVTVAFANGQTRSFQPQFVAATKAARRQAATPA